MNAISQEFAPPFKLIAPFFILGSLFYLLSTLLLFAFDASDLFYTDSHVISFVHIFLLGFVMMTIFGAMAQLIPVVLEVGHFAVELFYAIWPLLLTGTLLMAGGFILSPKLLPYGGLIVLISLMIFVGETLLTIKRVKEFTVVMSSVLIANTFLFIGIIFGLIMALGYAGQMSVDIYSLLRAHAYLVIGGYVSITIMGLSVILLPMFGLSHGFSLTSLYCALYMMSFAVIFVVIASFFDLDFLLYIGCVLSILSQMIYFYQVYTIYKTRVRKENDIYAKSLIFAYLSLVGALFLESLFILMNYEPFLISGAWLLFFGFFGFMITGHIYKIIPFLVWFERFSPLVGKEKVPMLADMLPKRSSEAQFLFSSIGVFLVAFALLSQNNIALSAGASFLVVGALAFVRSVLYMINFKK